MEPSQRGICPHCNKERALRTIRKHLASRLANQDVSTTSAGPSRLGSDGMDVDEEDVGRTRNHPEEEIHIDFDDGGQTDIHMEIPDVQDHDVPTIRHNPPVTIEDWPEPEPEDCYVSDTEDVPEDSADQDPPFVEIADPPEYDPDFESEFTDEEIQRLLELHLGTMDEGEWEELYDTNLSKKDKDMLRFLATRLRTHFSRNTYDDLRFGICDNLSLPSEFIAWRRLRILSGLESRTYDCCINSCCCYLGKYKDNNACPYCKEPRYNARNKPRRVFRYAPLIPQLRALFQNPVTAQKIRYRSTLEAERKDNPDRIEDIFDGSHFRSLRNTQVSPDDPYCFFDNPEDIALSLSTDGFTLFKRRRRGHSTAWPIILINNNLSPRIRTKMENVICVGVIPGPRQCKDLNSFLVPLLDELLELEKGVATTGFTPDGKKYFFIFRGFLILIFGDIPAITKVLMLKGHNGFSPCRACYIEGFLYQLGGASVYYVPHVHPGGDTEWDITKLPMRTHALFLEHTAKIEQEKRKTKKDKLTKHYGINSLSVLSKLKSFDLAVCAPYDIMHLFFENLVPNMILHWTGEFKGLDEGRGSYQISPADWEMIGKETAAAVQTIPSAFVGTLLNIAQDGHLYKAEAHAFWIQFIAPIVLKGRLPEKYYKHTLLLREIIILCVEWSVSPADVTDLEHMVQTWVAQYEEYYYQYSEARLPACPLTIHALLHIPWYLRHMGPLWTSWAFVMERFCGHLLPAVKNRIRPYEHIDNYVQRRAQMQIVATTHDLPALSRHTIAKQQNEDGIVFSSREVIYPDFPCVVLGSPINKKVHVDTTLMNRFTKYFGVVYAGRSAQYLRTHVDTGSVVRYGRVRILGDGDKIRTAALISGDHTARDNSFVRYALLPDANAAFRNRPDVPFRETQYGQLLDIYYLTFTEEDGSHKPYLLALIQPCDTRGFDATEANSPIVTYQHLLTPHIVALYSIEAAVGRVLQGNKWAIIDRSRGGVRTQFVDSNGNDVD